VIVIQGEKCHGCRRESIAVAEVADNGWCSTLICRECAIEAIKALNNDDRERECRMAREMAGFPQKTEHREMDAGIVK